MAHRPCLLFCTLHTLLSGCGEDGGATSTSSASTSQISTTTTTTIIPTTTTPTTATPTTTTSGTSDPHTEGTDATSIPSTSGVSATSSSDDGTVPVTTGDGESSTDQLRQPVPFCRPKCSAAKDCSNGLPGYEEHNWSCITGGCVWLGCMSDEECSPGSKCAPTNSDAGFKAYCFEACETAATCGQGIGPYISENHVCEKGACIYLGCGSNVQCKELQSNWTCHADTPPTCLQECISSAECGSNLPAWDADNYVCQGGACIYLGCNSDRECDASQVCVAAE
jgi:hypothetical protein